jgi:hypothetical protein
MIKKTNTNIIFLSLFLALFFVNNASADIIPFEVPIGEGRIDINDFPELTGEDIPTNIPYQEVIEEDIPYQEVVVDDNFFSVYQEHIISGVLVLLVLVICFIFLCKMRKK